MVYVCKAVVTGEVDSLHVARDMYILMMTMMMMKMMMMMMLCCTAIVRKVDGFLVRHPLDLFGRATAGTAGLTP